MGRLTDGGVPPRWGVAALLTGLIGAYVLCTPLRDLWYPDEPDVARVVQEMALSGQWLRPTLLGEDFASYPPLFYWAAVLSARIGGLAEFFLRLPSVLAAGVLLCATYIWARVRLGRPAASWAVAVLGTSYLFFYQAVQVQVDMVFAAFVGLAVFAFDLARRSERGIAPWGMAAAGLAMGLGALTKGPLGILLPGAVLTLDSVLRRRWRDLLPLAACGVVSTAIFCAWAALYSQASGPGDLAHFLWSQNVGRFVKSDSHDRPFYYYLLDFPADAMPWPLFLVAALPGALRCARQGSRPHMLALIWLAGMFAFFSMASSKRGVYLLPLYPAMAVVVGAFLAERVAVEAPVRWARALLYVVAGFLVLGGGGLVLGAPRLVEETGKTGSLLAPLLALQALLVGGGVVMLVLLRRRAIAPALRTLPAVVALVFAVVLGWFMPAMDDPISARRYAVWLDQQIDQGAGERLGVYYHKGDMLEEATALCFYGGFDAAPIRTGSDLADFWRRQPGDPVVAEEHDLAKLEEAAGMDLVVIRTLHIGSDDIVVVGLPRPAPGQPADEGD